MLKKRVLVIIAVVLCFFIVGSVIKNMMPKDIKDDTFYEINPIENTEYLSDIHTIGKESFCTYAFLNENGADNGDDEFVITIAKIEGILNNRYNIYVFDPIDNDWLINPSYFNISHKPQYEVKKGDKYYGSVYVGILPADCKSVTVQGQKAILKNYSIDLNGKEANFVFYCCFVEESSYPENANIEYETD